MTHVIFAIDQDTYIHQNIEKSPEEIRRQIELGVWELPLPVHAPCCVQLMNYLLVAERETPPLMTTTQRHVMELLSLGASLSEIGRALHLSFSGVRYHVETLKEKFHVTTREELISIWCSAYRQGG